MTRQSRDFGVGPDTPGHTSPLFGASAGWRRQHAARDKHAVIAATAVNAALCASAPLSHQTTTTTTTISHVHQTHISPSLGWARPCFGASASICSKFAQTQSQNAPGRQVAHIYRFRFSGVAAGSVGPGVWGGGKNQINMQMN